VIQQPSMSRFVSADLLSCVGGNVQQTDCDDSNELCVDGAAADGGTMCM
jgi:hypothetical protein